MKNSKIVAFGIMLATLPLFVSAEISTTTPSVPVHVSPVDNTALTSTAFTSADWTDAVLGATSSSYYYEASLSSSTTAVDGNFLAPIFVSPLLASSTIATTGTLEGTYYWHVRSVDVASGNKSMWSTTSKIVIDNTAPTLPGNPVLVSSILPVITPATSTTATTTTNGTQVWSFASSTDTGSGVAQYQYSLNGTSTWTDNALNTSISTNLSVGTFTMYVRALDRAGNISLFSSTLFTITGTSTTATTTTVIPPSTLLNTNQCKKNAWKTFTNPKFKNQGQCVSYVEKMLRDKKKAENIKKQEILKLRTEARKNLTKREAEVTKMVKAANAKKADASDKSHWENFAKTVGAKKELETSKKEETSNTKKNENRGNGNEKKDKKND